MDNKYAKTIEHDLTAFVNNVHIDTITDAAKRYGYSFESLGKMISRIKTDFGDIYFYDFVSPQTSIASQYVYNNKYLTKEFFRKENFNTPKGEMFLSNEKEKALQWFLVNKKIVVVKPVNAIHSKGITLNISSQLEFENAWEKAVKYSKNILVEEMVSGNDYRLVVIDGKYVAATAKTPLTIRGDGESSVEQLFDKLNNLREQNPHTASKKKVVITKEILTKLSTDNLTRESVLEKDRVLQLSLIPNVSAGGTHQDITQEVHKEFQEIVEQVSKRLPPNGYMAVDLLAQDIRLSPKEQVWNLIEINESLSLPHNHFPLLGKSRDVSGKIIEQNVRLLKKENEEQNVFSNIAPVYDQEEQNYSTKSIKKHVLYRAARERNLIVNELNKDVWYVSNDNGETHYFKYIMPDTMSTVGQKITAYKHISLKLLDEQNIPTPQSKSFRLENKEKAWEYAKSFNSCVVKPYTGSGGSGVFIDIKNKDQFFKAVKKQGKDRFLVEKYIKGQDYRVLVVDNCFVAASRRVPAYIIGNGKSTLQELINEKNELRSKNPYTATKLIKVSITRKKELAKQNILMDTIISNDTKVNLQKVANVSAGGENEDITEEVHPEFQRICTQIVKAYPGLFMGGIDIQAQDLLSDPKDQEWAVIEVNANPDLQMHHFPVHGIKRDVSGVLIDALFKKKIDCEPVTYKVTIDGEIQDEHFLYWLKEQAYLFALNGWAKNIDKNMIEIFIKGMPNSANGFIDKCVETLTLSGELRSIRKRNSSQSVEKGFRVI